MATEFKVGDRVRVIDYEGHTGSSYGTVGVVEAIEDDGPLYHVIVPGCERRRCVGYGRRFELVEPERPKGLRPGARVRVLRSWFLHRPVNATIIERLGNGDCWYVQLDHSRHNNDLSPHGSGVLFMPGQGWAVLEADLALLPPEPTLRAVGRRIKAERARQDAKFGPLGNLPSMTPEERLAVLTEEVGELAQRLNDVRQSRGPDGLGDSKHTRKLEAEAHEELVQVAAVAVAWLEVLESEGVP